ncbi:hypothetical protein PR048_015029 [Dryococelus australis]|uniref:Uncharacterized protein n=1 Tax=Dryococelus australis TaxID=614101 RepID=A0ABQ9HFY3_9NEOP|nr:hypothetical protein PR048_015029 [Dryococelus australis]
MSVWKKKKLTLVCCAGCILTLRAGGVGYAVPGGLFKRRAHWFDYSPPTKANRAQPPTGSLPDFSQVVIVPDDAAGRRVFSGISLAFRRFSNLTSFHPPLEHIFASFVVLRMRRVCSGKGACFSGGLFFASQERAKPSEADWEGGQADPKIICHRVPFHVAVFVGIHVHSLGADAAFNQIITFGTKAHWGKKKKVPSKQFRLMEHEHCRVAAPPRNDRSVACFRLPQARRAFQLAIDHHCYTGNLHENIESLGRGENKALSGTVNVRFVARLSAQIFSLGNQLFLSANGWVWERLAEKCSRRDENTNETSIELSHKSKTEHCPHPHATISFIWMRGKLCDRENHVNNNARHKHSGELELCEGDRHLSRTWLLNSHPGKVVPYYCVLDLVSLHWRTAVVDDGSRNHYNSGTGRVTTAHRPVHVLLVVPPHPTYPLNHNVSLQPSSPPHPSFSLPRSAFDTQNQTICPLLMYDWSHHCPGLVTTPQCQVRAVCCISLKARHFGFPPLTHTS